jgi:putative ABC transport system permease protein
LNAFELLRAGIAGLLAHKFRSALTLVGVTLGSLLLFCSLSGGMGVTKAVNTRLSVGDRLREIIVSSGVKTDEVTVQMAKDAGFTEAMPDERRIRLATASGVGGIRPVTMSLPISEHLATLPGVESTWSIISFPASAYLESADVWAPATARSLPSKRVDYSELRIAGKGDAPFLSKDGTPNVWVAELFLYQNGIRTTQEVQSLLGSTIELASRNPNLEQAEASRRNELESRLSFRSDRFTITGVFRYPDRQELRLNPDYSSTMRASVLLPYATATQCYRGLGMEPKKTTAIVLAESAKAVPEIESQIAEMGYATRSLAEIATQIQTAVLLITLIITAIAAGALLISAIGITNTMVMNVLERRKDIAVMKAIGARDRDLRRMFLFEGFLMGLVGGSLGLLLGLLFSEFCGQWIHQQLEERLNEPLGESVFAYPWWLIVGTPLLASVVTMLASYLPATHAAKIDPAQILRGL